MQNLTGSFLQTL